MSADVEAAVHHATSREFLELLAARDFGRLAATLAPDARARFLLPHGLEEWNGREAIAGRIASWFGSASEFELASASEDRTGLRQRVNYRFRIVRDGRTHEVIEQAVFLDPGPEGIEQVDLLCSGFQRDDADAPEYVFDAGAMGCADGLAQEFRNRLNDVPLGASIRVVVRDPAAKEDLPALARMLGQSVASVEAHEDGRLAITVEKVK